MESSEKKDKKKFKISLKLIKKVAYFIALILIILLIVSKFSKNRVTYDSATNLISIEEVEKFNLAKFKWDGIAKYYKEEKKIDVSTYIKYEAEIVATINLDDFSEKNITIDKNAKKIYITLPEIELKPTIVFKEDGDSFSFIPSNTKIEMKDIIATCEEDAKAKVQERIKILDIAKENAKNTIEGLLLPLVEEGNYTIVWKDGE